jgi:hypothetical protein
LERDFVTLCRFDPDGLGIEEQPVTINWTDADGRQRRYTPDFRVVRRNSTEIVEVKYRKDLWAKWSAYKPIYLVARDWASRQGMRFRIATDRRIRVPMLVNAKRLLPRLHDPVAAETERRILGAIARLQPISLSNLVEELIDPELRAEVILSAVWPLLARRTIIADLDVEISGTSMLSVVGALR